MTRFIEKPRKLQDYPIVEDETFNKVDSSDIK
jgi:hypothetical protein